MCFEKLSSMCKDEKIILTQANHQVICIANMILQFLCLLIELGFQSPYINSVWRDLLKNNEAQFICFYMAIISSISHQTLWANNKETLIYDLQWNIQISLYFLIAFTSTEYLLVLPAGFLSCCLRTIFIEPLYETCKTIWRNYFLIRCVKCLYIIAFFFFLWAF